METREQHPTGVENGGVIDMMAFDKATDEVLLVMREPREWSGGDEQLLELQEKFNAYASFLLDGELVDSHPELTGKRARIELECGFMPSEQAVTLLNAIHDQLALQEIGMEVIVAGGEGCGTGCTCH